MAVEARWRRGRGGGGGRLQPEEAIPSHFPGRRLTPRHRICMAMAHAFLHRKDRGYSLPRSWLNLSPVKFSGLWYFGTVAWARRHPLCSGRRGNNES